MEMKFDFDKEMNNYFANEFASNEKKWEPVANYLATVYMKNFVNNLDFMANELEKDVKNHIAIEKNEKLRVILKNIALQECIDDSSNSYSLDIGKIRKVFVPVTKNELKQWRTNIEEIDEESLRFNNKKFSDLDKKADFLLTFINNEDFRRKYYNGIYNNKDINSNLFVNLMDRTKDTSTFLADASSL